MTASSTSPLPNSAPLRLAAIDLDGTLLSPDLTISEANRRAITRLQAAGIEVVLASGRHHASMRPFAAQLPDVRWLVSTQGAEVSNVARTEVLGQTFLSREELATVAALQRQLGMTAIFYTPDGVLTDAAAGDEHVQFYTDLAGLTPERVTLADLAQRPIYKTVWSASTERIDGLTRDPQVAALAVQKVRTHHRLYEFMPTTTSKATGLAALAKHLGLSAQNAVVFGDAENDIPMFEWAALSFAMPHGWPLAQARAHCIAPAGPAESAFARAVEVLEAEGRIWAK